MWVAPDSALDDSQFATTFEAHGSPRRRTISGTCSAANCFTRKRASAAATVGAPSSPGILAPDRGSARTGQPRMAANWRTVSGRPAPAPATITPLAEGRARATRASNDPGAGIRRTGLTRCHGRPFLRPGGRSPVSVNRGSRNARFACTGPGPIGPATASATSRLPSDLQLDLAASSGTPGSTAQRSAPTKSDACSTVCGAPT